MGNVARSRDIPCGVLRGIPVRFPGEKNYCVYRTLCVTYTAYNINSVWHKQFEITIPLHRSPPPTTALTKGSATP
ncbi:hypothetical protein CLV54_2539 [Compostimonas suwonensis]|uniref:Uncharacterized protein n=1 Tax=Compostimonas suwonensis TaxID=1048394 RepID=A0A2M9BUJ2_9MICO|nr:hypothetical protein CLV54_2539 [Compostimonas suwonensis]